MLMKKSVCIILLSSILCCGFTAAILAQDKQDAAVSVSENQLGDNGLMGYISFVIPVSWSKISKDYDFDYGRGLDA